MIHISPAASITRQNDDQPILDIDLWPLCSRLEVPKGWFFSWPSDPHQLHLAIIRWMTITIFRLSSPGRFYKSSVFFCFSLENRLKKFLKTRFLTFEAVVIKKFSFEHAYQRLNSKIDLDRIGISFHIIHEVQSISKYH